MLTELLDHYGYVAVLVGTVLEGETILILAGFAAHQGYLQLPGVMLAAFVGSLSGDVGWFFLGRRYGQRALARFPRLRAGVERATGLLQRRETMLLLSFRFVYGIRTVTPLAAGLSSMPAARFLLLNAVGAAAWSVVIAGAGYVLGHGFVSLLDRARVFEEHAFIAIVLAGATWFVVHALLARRKPRGPASPESRGG
jgi:membrane protein DedA with SNARE-associated domain